MEERRAFNLDMARQLGRIEGKLDDLCGDRGRVTKIEEEQERAKQRAWIHTAFVVPVMTGLHLLAKKLGI